MKRLHSDDRPPIAREFMQEKVFSFAPDADIREAVPRLLSQGYSGAPVVDAQGVLVGMLSEWDCARILSEAAYEGWPTGSVREHMTRDVESVAPTTDLFTILALFTGHGHRRFPVVENGQLVGLITRRDLLRALYQHASAKQRPPSTYDILEKQQGE